jgi:transcriptional/translational regulatory protein YebC/TACO1
VRNQGEVYEIITTPTAFHRVRDALAAAGVPIEAAEIAHLPNSTVPVQRDAAHRILKLIDVLEDHEDVQSVSHNAEIPESVAVDS